MRQRSRGTLRGVLGGAVLAGAAGLTACSVLSLEGLSSGGADAALGSPAADGGDDTTTDAREDATVDAPVPADGSATPDGALDGGTMTCGADGGGLLCSGTCIDPASDPNNCNGCGNVCSTGRCGASIVASMASAPTSWSLNGSAFYNTFAPSAELTPIGNYLAGSFIYVNPIAVDAFDVKFDFRMGLQGGSRSDGMAFVLEQNGPSAVGGTGGALGMGGLVGYGVELDIWNNGVCGDVSDDHVGVDELTVCNAPAGTPTSLVSQDVTGVVDIADTSWHAAGVTFANGALSLSIDGHPFIKAQPLLNLKAGTAYYFGFTAATGGLVGPDGGPGGYRQEVKNIAITFPTPRCL